MVIPLTGAESWLIGHIPAVIISVTVCVQTNTRATPAGKLADPARWARMCAPQQPQHEQQPTRPPTTHPATINWFFSRQKWD